MIKLSQAVIVEGKYDKIKLKSILDAVIITTDGFRIYKDKEKLELIRSFAKKSGIIILTDSDKAGFQIRSYLKSSIREGNIIHVYIPDILGKEKRKEKPSKEGTLGVEGLDINILRNALYNAGVIQQDTPRTNTLTKADLMNDGFIGNYHAAYRRRLLLNALDLPLRLNTNSLLDVLNRLISVTDYQNAVKQVNSQTISYITE
jgi:ribonuclease M5